jgi:hypothetical protein
LNAQKQQKKKLSEGGGEPHRELQQQVQGSLFPTGSMTLISPLFHHQTWKEKKIHQRNKCLSTTTKLHT